MTATTEKRNRKHIDELHFDNKLHLNQLAFYKQELEIFKHRLEEVASKNTKTEVTAQIEQYQNQFIRQLEVHDELRHKLKQHENQLEEAAKNNPTAIDHVLFNDNSALNEEIERYATLYAEMKDNFYRFLSEWM
jgi:DNA repair exonuclease SbcCD ATPase subunit